MDPKTPVEKAFRLIGTQKAGLKTLGIHTIEDVLFHFPARYEDIPKIKSIKDLAQGDDAVIYGKVTNLKKASAFRTRMSMTTARIEDPTGSIGVVWFHQPYISTMVKEDAIVQLKGKVSQRKPASPKTSSRGGTGELYFANPELEETANLPIDSMGSLFATADGSIETDDQHFFPVYGESRGITSRWFFYAIKKILSTKTHELIEDVIPPEILAKYHLPQLSTALVWIHHPRKVEDSISARKRFSFEEIFLIQLARQRMRKLYQSNPAYIVKPDTKELERFIERFPFELTVSQTNAIKQITRDFGAGVPMSRLLEGDVGSGKTAVAAATAHAIATSRPQGQTFGNLQVAIMAPTEILATQHFESFIKYFAHLPINVGLITSSGCRKFPSKVNPESWTDISRAQLLKWVAAGEIPILIGTHALIQKSVKFKHLAYTIIDEQHRFGTNQRLTLTKKHEIAPHLLSMTATPIPRTLALTIYGDLDLTLLSEMPAGRKPIKTEIVLPGKRDDAYKAIRTELKAGRQLYVICPRIDEPDPDKEQALIAKSVKQEAKRLKEKVFGEYEIDILHSKMSTADKEYTMAQFAAGKINILVATSVVEVGVNVPNATVIVIEGAERFGLSQLHQLRGRVLRSSHQAYCYIFSETKTQKTFARLKAIETAKNGFELAELDLSMRGSGELYGRKQWGISDLGMEAIKNIKMVEAARTEALHIITSNTLDRYPALAIRLDDVKNEIHFE